MTKNIIKKHLIITTENVNRVLNGNMQESGDIILCNRYVYIKVISFLSLSLSHREERKKETK